MGRSRIRNVDAPLHLDVIEALAEIGRFLLYFEREICQHPRNVFLAEAWFDARRGFKGFHAYILGRFTQ